MQNASTSFRVLIDTSYLVGLVDHADAWHTRAAAIHTALKGNLAHMVYTDCVIGEAIGVVARRLEEKGRSAQFVGFLDLIHEYAPSSAIAWIFEQVRRWYEPILEQVRSSQGRLNFNDALLILAAREMGVSAIVSFDRDFDDVPGLVRLHRPEDVALR